MSAWDESARLHLIAAAAEAVHQVIWGVTAEGELVDDSPSWRTFTGQTNEQAKVRGWLDAVHTEDREGVERALREAREQRGALDVEYRVRRPGDRFTRTRARGVPVLDAAGEMVGWVVSSSEVWVDESVRRSEERLRLATEAARVAVWEYDFVAGQMTRTENHDALYGIPPLQVWQYDVFTNATHPDDRALSDRIVQTSCAPGGPDDYAFDFRVIWPDGSVHWLAVSGHVTARDAEGRATLVRGALIDVTRLKNIEAELREAVQMRDEFLQIASHELNTPLTPLSLKLATLERLVSSGQPSSEELLHQLDSARRQVRRLAELVADLLDVTRLSQGRMHLSLSDVSFAEVVQRVVEEVALDAQRSGCELSLGLEGAVVGLWDRARLEQVVENLLSNALKYGQGKPIRIELKADAGRARLTVADQGIGIEPEALPRLFDKFERAPSARSYGGLGLGLFIVRQIVEAFGGQVSVSSKPGAGATFVVELPLSDRSPTRP